MEEEPPVSEQKEDCDLDSYTGAGSCANVGAVCPSLHKTHLGRVRPDSHSFFPREPCSPHHLNSSVIWEQKTWDKSSQSRCQDVKMLLGQTLEEDLLGERNTS